MSERSGQTQVAGLWCGDVLERLPELVDGTLDAGERSRVEAHVAACDWCARFGGTYASLVRSLSAAGRAVPDAVGDRLRSLVDGDLPDQDAP